MKGCIGQIILNILSVRSIQIQKDTKKRKEEEKKEREKRIKDKMGKKARGELNVFDATSTKSNDAATNLHRIAED